MSIKGKLNESSIKSDFRFCVKNAKRRVTKMLFFKGYWNVLGRALLVTAGRR